MKEVFERQAVILRLTHRDGRNDEDLQPTKVTWSLHDALSGTALREDVEITSITSHIVDIEILSVDNRILTDTNAEEERIASIRSEFSGNSFATKEYSYRVKNMGHWTPT